MVKSGIVLVDKPRGPSSHQTVAWVGEILHTSVGHSGTLDPQVSGVLVVMTGKAVKLAPLLLQHEKEYVACMRLHADVDRETVECVVKRFTGRIYQRPPRRSAVKRSLRIRVIHKIEVLDMQGRLVLLRIRCEAGTYIRSLCVHIGNVLGCGAQMIELRRTMSGGFRATDAHTLQGIRDVAENGTAESLILPPESAISDIPKIVIRDSAATAVYQGAKLAVPGIISVETFSVKQSVALVTAEGKLVALAESLQDSDKIVPGGHGFAAKSIRVFSAE